MKRVMVRLFAAFLVGSLVGNASGQVPPAPVIPVAAGPLTLPAETPASVGGLIDLPAGNLAVGAAKKILWRVPDAFDYRVVDGGTRLIAVPKPGTPPGRYTVLAIGAAGDEPQIAEGSIVVGAHPAPPGPIPPGPNPMPPVPPVVPDGLATDLKRAFDESPGTLEDKRKSLANLIELYRQATALTTDAKKSATAIQLKTILKAAAATLLKEELMPLRAIVGAELAKVLPTDQDAPLTEAARTAAAGLFTKIILRLEAIK